MSPSASRLGLLGNPENRRLQDFAQAVVKLGFAAPLCLSYRDLLEQPDALDRFDVDLLRLDSPGENEEVARSLIALGGGPSEPVMEFGEIAYLGEYHRGFCRLLERVGRRRLACLNDPTEIAMMFDKWVCHQLFVERAVARPPAELAPVTFQEMRERMGGSGRLFLKPLHGSSASGVCALRWMPGRAQLIAPLRIREGRLFNNLKVISYERLADIELILSQLLPQGMIAEHWIPKLALDGGVLDLRVLVIAGQARHRVVRQSHHPMTNLHLGNRRGDEEALRAHLGEKRWAAALHLAEQAAACFPHCLYAGVDILLDCAGKAWVGEINAFGDLLPGLTHRGETAYQAIASAVHCGECQEVCLP